MAVYHTTALLLTLSAILQSFLWILGVIFQLVSSWRVSVTCIVNQKCSWFQDLYGNTSSFMTMYKPTSLCSCMYLSFAADSILFLSKKVRELGKCLRFQMALQFIFPKENKLTEDSIFFLRWYFCAAWILFCRKITNHRFFSVFRDSSKTSRKKPGEPFFHSWGQCIKSKLLGWNFFIFLI